MTLHQNARKLTPEMWHQKLMDKIGNDSVDLNGIEMPGIGSELLQQNLNGRPALNSMPEAFRLFEYCRGFYKDSSLGDFDNQRYLDFGAGWGRIWRYFIYDFEIKDMSAFDVNPGLANFWQSEMAGGELSVGKPGKQLPFDDDTFDFVTSNSVFSHLSKELNLLSMNEISRVMKPGGIFVFTTFGRSSLSSWSKLKSKKSLDARQKVLANLSDDYSRVIRGFDEGEFVFLKTGYSGREKGDLLHDYEIAATPVEWVRDAWGDRFEIVDTSVNVTPQLVIVVRKRR